MEADSLSAKLLLAVPQMQDPNFMHTVVLVCDHGTQGAFGFVANHPAPFTVDTLLPDHAQLAGSGFPVFLGGPVGREQLQIVHRVRSLAGGAHEFAPGLFLGGDVERIFEHVASRPGARRDLRFFLGYSGWAPDQLDMELRSGSWVPAPLDREVVFGDGAPETIWRQTMRKLGRGGEGLSHLPPDVSWN